MSIHSHHHYPDPKGLMAAIPDEGPPIHPDQGLDRQQLAPADVDRPAATDLGLRRVSAYSGSAPSRFGPAPTADVVVEFETRFEALCAGGVPATSSGRRQWQLDMFALVDSLSNVQTTAGWLAPSPRAITVALGIVSSWYGRAESALVKEAVKILWIKADDARPFKERARELEQKPSAAARKMADLIHVAMKEVESASQVASPRKDAGDSKSSTLDRTADRLAAAHVSTTRGDVALSAQSSAARSDVDANLLSPERAAPSHRGVGGPPPAPRKHDRQ